MSQPELYDDDEQTQTMNARAAIPARTRQRWQERYRDAEAQYGSGFLSPLPRYHNCGGQRKISSEVIALVHRVLETHYDTVTRKLKRGAYGEYLKCSEEQRLKTVDQKTFYLEARRHRAAYDQTVAHEGTRAAYPFKDYVLEQEQTVNRHGSYAWARVRRLVQHPVLNGHQVCMRSLEIHSPKVQAFIVFVERATAEHVHAILQ